MARARWTSTNHSLKSNPEPRGGSSKDSISRTASGISHPQSISIADLSGSRDVSLVEQAMKALAPGSEADARALLDAVVSEAATSFGPRLLAVYAIGSLAHGGFSPLCSDVDAAIIVDDPLVPGDGESIATIAA